MEQYKVPFELKTGRMWNKLGSAEHRAQVTHPPSWQMPLGDLSLLHVVQVILYTLMLRDRYNVEVPGGLLHYLSANHMQGVPAFPQEKRGEWNVLLFIDTLDYVTF